jgi:radical SAM protein with 4Fe4S-binding SPASM domain
VQALAEALGVTYILDPTVTPMLDGDRGVVANRVATSDLLPVFQDPAFNKKSLVDVETSPQTSHADSGAPTMQKSYDNIPCSAGQNNAYISPYGDVYPCVQMPVATGNLRRLSFREIWYGSPEMRRVRDVRESMLEICPTCSIKQYCQRCPGLAQLEDGDMLGPSSRACELAELTARVAGVENPLSAYHAWRNEGKILAKPAPRVSHLVTIAPLAV